MIPKKHKNISVRVTEEHRLAFVAALKKRGLTEAFFLRAVTEALIGQVAAGEDLVLPIQLMSVQRRDGTKPKKARSRRRKKPTASG